MKKIFSLFLFMFLFFSVSFAVNTTVEFTLDTPGLSGLMTDLSLPDIQKSSVYFSSAGEVTTFNNLDKTLLNYVYYLDWYDNKTTTSYKGDYSIIILSEYPFAVPSNYLTSYTSFVTYFFNEGSAVAGASICLKNSNAPYFSSNYGINDWYCWSVVSSGPVVSPITHSSTITIGNQFSSFNIFQYTTSTVINSNLYLASNLTVSSPSMSSPLTNAETLSLVNELLSSSVAVNRPRDFNKFFIQYDSTLSAYFAFFYPDNATVAGSIRPQSVSGLDYDTYLLYGSKTVGFWENFFGANELEFNYYVAWKGNYYNAEPWGFYNRLSNVDIIQKYYHCIDQPLVYTSTDLGFVLWYLGEGDFMADDLNSISGTVLTDELGNPVEIVLPDTISQYNEGSLMDGITSSFSIIFLPDTQTWLSFKALTDEKFGFFYEAKDILDTFITVITNAPATPPVITFDFSNTSSDSYFHDVGEVNVFDLTWYAPYKQTFDTFFLAFVYFGFVYRLFRKAPSIIQGKGGEN